MSFEKQNAFGPFAILGKIKPLTNPLQKSSDAVRYFHEALSYEQSDPERAYQLLLASVADDPTLPGAWNNLGMVLNRLRRYPAAVAAFHRAHFLAPDAPLPFANYAWALHLAGRSKEALPLVCKIVEADPKKSANWISLSQIYLALGEREAAMNAGSEAIASGNDKPEAHMAYGLALLRNGYYAEGFREYEARIQFNPILRKMLDYPFPAWRGEDISNRRLFIPCEQGIGDSVMAMRFIPLAAKKAKRVVVHVHNQVYKFYKRNLANLQNVDIYPIPCELPAADVYCPTLSLPVALGLSQEEIENSYYRYKHGQAGDVKAPGKLRVGICWAGDPNHDNDRYRSSTLEAFLLLSEAPDVQLFSFQVGPRAQDIDVLGAHGVVKDMSPYLRSVADTAAIIGEHMHAVVSVDTSVAHIAASIGKPTYLCLSKTNVDWRWGSGDGSTVWYPSMQMVQQKPEGDWASVMWQVKQQLDATQSNDRVGL